MRENPQFRTSQGGLTTPPRRFAVDFVLRILDNGRLNSQENEHEDRSYRCDGSRCPMKARLRHLIRPALPGDPGHRSVRCPCGAMVRPAARFCFSCGESFERSVTSKAAGWWGAPRSARRALVILVAIALGLWAILIVSVIGSIAV